MMQSYPLLCCHCRAGLFSYVGMALGKPNLNRANAHEVFRVLFNTIYIRSGRWLDHVPAD